jgi:hypothetical protein
MAGHRMGFAANDTQPFASEAVLGQHQPVFSTRLEDMIISCAGPDFSGTKAPTAEVYPLASLAAPAAASATSTA